LELPVGLTDEPLQVHRRLEMPAAQRDENAGQHEPELTHGLGRRGLLEHAADLDQPLEMLRGLVPAYPLKERRLERRPKPPRARLESAARLRVDRRLRLRREMPLERACVQQQ